MARDHENVLLVTILVLTFILTPTVLGQVNVRTVGLNVGMVRGILSYGRSGRENVFYPEIHVGGEWFCPFLEWSTYWGYWDDGVDQVNVSDAQVYSTHGHILGARMTFLPEHIADQGLFPLALFAGGAHQIVSYKYIGGSDGLGTPVMERTESVNTLEFGARLYARLSERLELRLEGHQFVGFGSEPLARSQSGRRAFTFGMAVSI